MNRLAIRTPLPLESQQIADHLMNGEGTCTCGRVLRKLDAKLVMMTAAPSKGVLIAAAYCLLCAGQINRVLKSLKNLTYSNTETAPVMAIRDVG